ncbi:VOC family protein [Pseudarthrobacter sp. NPDC092419]|uniref:VOC family protein n=1 Tax=Pseudarthrobacter sp. NPDC092419 TaxID=3364414 RepID=UPI0037F4A203
MSSRRVVSAWGGSVEPGIMNDGGDALNKVSATGGSESPFLADTSRPRHEGVRKIDHVAMAAHDADASSQWFEEVLGLQRIHDEVVEDVGVRLLWLAPRNAMAEAGEASLQIVQPLGPGAVADFLAQKGEGLHHVCFAVDNAEDFLKSRGQVGGIFTGGYGLPCAFLKAAPDGIAVEIVQREHPAS